MSRDEERPRPSSATAADACTATDSKDRLFQDAQQFGIQRSRRSSTLDAICDRRCDLKSSSDQNGVDPKLSDWCRHRDFGHGPQFWAASIKPSPA